MLLRLRIPVLPCLGLSTVRAWLLVVIAVGMVSLPGTATSQEAGSVTKWTSVAGKEIEAEFVRRTDKGVVLRLKANGQEAEVPYAQLSLESHLQAIKLDKPEAFSKPLLKAEVKSEVVAAEPTLILDAAEILRSPFTKDMSLERYLEVMQREVQAGNMMVGWHGLPPKMQGDIEALASQGAELLGSGTIAQWRTLLGNVNTIIQEKRDFLLKNPALASQPQVTSIAKQIWPQLAGFSGSFTKESLWQAANFQKGNFPTWLADFTAATVPHGMALYETIQPMLPPQAPAPQTLLAAEFKILSQSADSAEIEVTVPGVPPQKKKMQKVGNLWIYPKEMNEARQQLDAAQEWLANADASQLAPFKIGLTGAIAVTGALAHAETQAEFDAAVEQLTAMAQAFAPAGPPGRNGPPGSSSGGSGSYNGSGSGGSGSGSSSGNSSPPVQSR